MNVCNSLIAQGPVLPGKVRAQTGMNRKEEELLSNADPVHQITSIVHKAVFL